MDRLTAHYVYFDGTHGYDALGKSADTQRPFFNIIRRLTHYEDTGYMPNEIAGIVAELALYKRALELACKESISCPVEMPGDCMSQEYYNCADCCKKYFLEQAEKEVNNVG